MFTELGKTSIQIKQNPIIFVQHFSFLSDQNFQTTGQLSSNNLEDFAKTDQGLQSIIVCTNDDPGVTLTYFTARSNLVT